MTKRRGIASGKMRNDAVKEILPFMRKWIKINGVSPSMYKIGAEFGRSHAWAWACTQHLLKEGYLEKDPTRKYKNLIIKK